MPSDKVSKNTAPPLKKPIDPGYTELLIPDNLIKLELKNMLTVSEAICRSALLRRESRGSHYRLDHPDEDNQNWLCNIVINNESNRMKLETRPVNRKILTELDIEVKTN